MKKSFLILLILLSTFPAWSQQPVSEKDFLVGKFNYRTAPDFSKVDKKYSTKPVYLNEVVYKAFKEMHRQAQSEGIELKIVSGTRSFDEQKILWEKKWQRLDSLAPVEKAKAILEYSAMPGTSRHHWGTDVDLNNLENCYFEEGRGKAEYDWLLKNAGKFGFYQVYTAQHTGRTGYKEEKWHWSYMPLAAKFLQRYNELVGYAEIASFEGSELAEETAMIPDYVNGISGNLQSPLPLSILPKGIVLSEGEEYRPTFQLPKFSLHIIF